MAGQANTGVVAERLTAESRAADDLAIFQLTGRNDCLKPIVEDIQRRIREWGETLIGCPLLPGDDWRVSHGFDIEALAAYLAGPEGAVMQKLVLDEYGVCIATSPRSVAITSSTGYGETTGATDGVTGVTSLSGGAHPVFWRGEVRGIAGNIKLSVCLGDIITHPTEAIVNPANEYLKHSGGVAEVIANAAGQGLVDECAAILLSLGQPTGTSGSTGAHGALRKLPVSSAVATGAYQISGVKHVIHTVGPKFQFGGAEWEREVFRKTIRCALQKVSNRFLIISGMPFSPLSFLCLLILRRTMKEPRACRFLSSAAPSTGGLSNSRLSCWYRQSRNGWVARRLSLVYSK